MFSKKFILERGYIAGSDFGLLLIGLVLGVSMLKKPVWTVVIWEGFVVLKELTLDERHS